MLACLREVLGGCDDFNSPIFGNGNRFITFCGLFVYASHNGVFWVFLKKSLPKRYIFQFTKYKDMGVSESTEFDTFSIFLHRNILFLESSGKDQTYILDILRRYLNKYCESKF